MAAEDIRLLRSAILLHRFTLQELAAHANVNRNTASSWWKRNGDAFQAVSSKAIRSGRGRPSKTWLATPEGVAKLRQQLEHLSVPDDIARQSAETPKPLEHIEKLISDWRAAVRTGFVDEAQEFHSVARLRVRYAWEEYADMEAARFHVPTQWMRLLAEYERELDIARLWEDTALPSVAGWVAQRLSTMSDAGISPAFSARVLRLRAEVRELPQTVRLTAATLAAQVWADEELGVSSGLSPNALRTCEIMIDQVALPTRAEELLSALNPSNNATYRITDEQRQAILLGLADRQRRKPVREVADWLLALRRKVVWSHELAPAVAYGAIEAPYVDAREIFEEVGDSLVRVLAAPILSSGRVGTVRANAHHYCRKFVSQFRTVPSARLMTGADIEELTRFYGSSRHLGGK